MPLTHFDIIFLSLYILTVAAVIFGVVYWRKTLDRWEEFFIARRRRKSEKMPPSSLGFFGFWKAALKEALSVGWLVFTVAATALPYLLPIIHKISPSLELFGLLRWVEAHPVRAHLICGAAAIGLYLFYAPYKLYSRLDKRLAILEARRPNYEFVTGWVDPTVQVGRGERWTAIANAVFRFRNDGTVSAYDPKARIYYCWLDNPSQIKRIDRDTFGGKTPVHDFLDIAFTVARPATPYAVVPQGQPPWNFGPTEELVVWIETESSAGSPHGPTFTDEIKRFSVIPYEYFFSRRMFSFQSSRHQRAAEAHFQEFRRREKESITTPLLDGLDT